MTPQLTSLRLTNIALTCLMALSIVIAAFAYSSGLENGIFLLDDKTNIQPTIITEPSWAAFVSATISNESGDLKRPISAASFAITSMLHGDHVWGFKYHNLLTHLLCGFLIFLLCYKLTAVRGNKTERYQRNRMYIATIASAIWLLHPLHVSTVLYSVQRMTQLATLFSLASIIIYLQGRLTTLKSEKYLYYFLLFPVSALAAILSKESGVLIVLFVAIFHIFLRQNNTPTTRLDNFFLYVSSLIPIALGAAVFALKQDRFLDYSSRDFSLHERLLSQIDVVFSYLHNLILPRLSRMGLYLDDIIAPTEMNLNLALKLTFLFLLFSYGLWQLVRGKLVGLGIALFFAGHVLESTIIPLELAFEHRNYFPSVGIFLAVSSGLASLAKFKRALIILLIAMLIILSTLLSLRVHFWSDHQNWLHTSIAFRPKSERTQLDYSAFIANHYDEATAAEHAKKTIKLIPDKLSLKFAYLKYGCESTLETDHTTLINAVYTSLKTQNLSVLAFNNLAGLAQLISKKHCNSISLDQVMKIVETATSLGPAKPSNMLPLLYFLQGTLSLRQGTSYKASDLFMYSYQLDGRYMYKLSSINALISVPKTRKEGLELLFTELKTIESRPLSERKMLLKIEEKIGTGDFSFTY